VTTPKLADLNVTTPKLADSAVTTAKLADLNVTLAKLAVGASVRVYGGQPTAANFDSGTNVWTVFGSVSLTTAAAPVLLLIAPAFQYVGSAGGAALAYMGVWVDSVVGPVWQWNIQGAGSGTIQEPIPTITHWLGVTAGAHLFEFKANAGPAGSIKSAAGGPGSVTIVQPA